MIKVLQGYKQVHDNVHGYIKISGLACMIMDTVEFQRLRYLHQLGTCHYVFPNGTHTRFEHSIGTYYLAGRMLEGIKNNSNPIHLNKCLDNVYELKQYYKRIYGKRDHYKLDEYVCELVKIAAMCHDLGHGPFSHVFDDVFIPHMQKFGKKKHFMDNHENRSCQILEYIVLNNRTLSETIKESELLFMKKLINPTDDDEGFIFQLVSNNMNSIDVDKFDYLARDTKALGLKFGFDYQRLVDDAMVLENKLCFPEQMYYEIASMFKTRYRLHKQIYSHKMVISIQYMFLEMMKLLDPIIGIYDSIQSVEKFVKLTDHYIISTVNFLYSNRHLYNEHEQKLIVSAHIIWERLNRRDLYKFITAIVTKKPLNPSLDKVIEWDTQIKPSDVVVHTSKIGLVGGVKDNPLNHLYFYKNKSRGKIMKIRKESMSLLLPSVYQEYIYLIFMKDRNNTALENRLYKVLESVEHTFGQPIEEC